MKVAVNSVKVGNIIEHQGDIWRVVKTQHVKPGKGGAYLQAELKGVRTGTKLNERFRASETLEKVRLEQKGCQFLYREGSMYHFMANDTYEQFGVSEGVMDEDALLFLEEGMGVHVSFYEEEALSLELPSHVTVEVMEADAVVKGQTAASSYKPALLANGVRVQVPPYVESGDKIVVNTSDKTFVERKR
jgi:elongation factor P